MIQKNNISTGTLENLKKYFGKPGKLREFQKNFVPHCAAIFWVRRLARIHYHMMFYSHPHAFWVDARCSRVYLRMTERNGCKNDSLDLFFTRGLVGWAENWKMKVSENTRCREEENEACWRDNSSKRKWRNACETDTFWSLFNPRGSRGGRRIGKGRCRKMRAIERKRMNLLARQSEWKWRNACEISTLTQTLRSFVNWYTVIFKENNPVSFLDNSVNSYSIAIKILI